MASRRPLRVFLDTNILFSGLYSSSSAPAGVLDLAALRAFTAVVSQAVLNELVRSLSRKSPNLLTRLPDTLVRMDVEVVRNVPQSAIDSWEQFGLREDAHVVAAAIAAECDFLCTGDGRFREKLAEHTRPFDVITARQLIDTLGGSSARQPTVQ